MCVCACVLVRVCVCVLFVLCVWVCGCVRYIWGAGIPNADCVCVWVGAWGIQGAALVLGMGQLQLHPDRAPGCSTAKKTLLQYQGPLLKHALPRFEQRASAHPPTHAPTHSPTHSPAHPPTHSLTRSLPHAPTHSLTHAPPNGTHPQAHVPCRPQTI